MVEKNGVEVGSVHATWSVKGALERPVVPDSVKIGFPRSWPSAWASLARATVISVRYWLAVRVRVRVRVSSEQMHGPPRVRGSPVQQKKIYRSATYFGHAM